MTPVAFQEMNQFNPWLKYFSQEVNWFDLTHTQASSGNIDSDELMTQEESHSI